MGTAAAGAAGCRVNAHAKQWRSTTQPSSVWTKEPARRTTARTTKVRAAVLGAACLESARIKKEGRAFGRMQSR